MKDYQNAVAKMIDEVLLFFKEMKAKKAEQSILQKHVTKLNELNIELEKYKRIQETDIKGIFIEKKKAKKELARNIYQLSGSLRSFATDNGNDLLYKEIDTAKSKLNILADLNLVSYSLFVIDKLNENKEQLVAYSITDKDITGLTTETEYFDELLLKPAKMRKEVKVATSNIKALITEMLNLLSESIDNDMLQYEDTQPELYKKYLVIREIDDSQTTALSIKGKVTGGDAEVEILEYVTVTAKFKAGTDWAEIRATSTKKGNYQFKGIPEGKCTLTFTLEYYDTLVVETVVRPDKYTRVDVIMKKTNV
jgi:hypothetical protein